jgi:hypothetical protein
MSFNGSGTFLINTAGQPVVSGTVISSTAFNALTADLATGLSTAITKDGQTTVTANIPMSTYKFTGLGVGSAATDSANLSQVQSTVTKLLTSVSGADTITAVGAPVVAAYAAGQMFYFVATGDNTGAVTLNIDALGAKAVTRDGSVALAAGDIKSGEVVVVVYDGTRFQVVSQLNSAGNATFANVSITSALNVGGVATFSAGTAAAPSITTTGDTNTGIFFPAADTIAFTEGGVEAARFDSSGNLGIGTSTPGSYLSGTAKLVAYANANAQNSILVRNDSAGSSASSAIALNAAGNTWGIEIGSSAKNSNALTFQLDYGGTNSTKMTIDSSGNLGLGVTPSAWQTFTSALEVPGGALAGISANQVGVWQNCFYNSSSFKYKSTAAATLYQQAGAVHAWYNAASGTAGNTISFTQAMTLDASGNLGVGLTSPGFPGVGRTISIDSASASTGSILWLKAGGTSYGYLFSNNVETALSSVAALPLTFKTNDTERARITAAGEFLISTTTTTGNGKFSSNHDSASTAGASSARIWNQIKNVAASNNATVDVWLGRDAAGNVIGNNSLVGHFNVFVIGASGVNAFAGVYSIITTGNGTSEATLSAVNTVTRGTSPVSSIQIANDGGSGAIKLTITYINNAGVVTGGNSQVSFIGQII